MNEQTVNLNDDQKAVLLKSLKNINFANRQLHDFVTKGSLSEEMAKTLPALIESYFSEAAEVLNYESHLLKEKEERYVEIRNANQKIHELEFKLGSSKPIDGLKEQLRYLHDQVSDWWRKEGFNHISEEKFSPYGCLHLQFCFMLDSSRLFSKTPVTDKEKHYDHIQHLRDRGFEFADNEKDSTYRKHLIDTEKNRKLLTTMLKERFPSLQVHRIDNRVSSDTGDFLIWHIEAAIYNLGDI